MTMRIQQTPLYTPRPGVEQKPSTVSTPTPAVQAPAAPVSQGISQGIQGSSFKTRNEVMDLQGGVKGPGADSVQRQLAVNSAYARLMEDPAIAKGLNALRVRDGAALASLGSLLASGKLPLWPEKQGALDKLRQAQPELFTQLVTLAQQLGLNAPAPASSTPGPAATQAAGALTAAQGAYDQAKGAALGLDQQLSRDLDAFGPALSGAQRQAYIEAFHGAHEAEYNQASQAEAALAATLMNPELDGLAAKDLNVAYATAQAAEALAGGSHSVEVLQWASRIMGGDNVAQDMFEHTQTGVAMPGWQGAGPAELRPPMDFDALRSDALAGAAGQLLAQANGNPEAALSQFSALASALGGDPAKTSQMLSALQKASAGDFSELSGMVQSADPMLQGLGSAATLFAGLQAKNGPQQAAYGQFLKDMVAAKGPGVVGNALRGLASASASAAPGSPAAAQLNANLGALTAALGTSPERVELFNDSSFDDNAQMLSDLSALAGEGATAMAPAADTALDAVTDSVADLITDLGDQLMENSRETAAANEAANERSAEHEKSTEREKDTREKETREKESRRTEERQNLLEKVGVSHSSAKTLAQKAEQPKELRSKVGQTPTLALLGALSGVFPDLFARAKATQNSELSRTDGVKSEGMQRLVDALRQDDTNFLQTLADRGEDLQAGNAESRALAARLFPRANELARQAERERA